MSRPLLHMMADGQNASPKTQYTEEGSPWMFFMTDTSISNREILMCKGAEG